MITAALIGSPNAGKTTVFNKLTGSIQRVGNWPGVTVERKQGYIRDSTDERILVVDLPGIYSLSPYSPEEIVSRDYLIGTSEDKPDVAINILDASNMERGLYLLMQVADLGMPMVVVLNMMDVAKRRGIVVDRKKLEEYLGCPVIETVASMSIGTDRIAKAVEKVHKDGTLPNTFRYEDRVEKAISEISEIIKSEVRDELVRWCAIKVIERDSLVLQDLDEETAAKCEAAVQSLEKDMGDDGLEIVASQRYYSAERCTKECLTDVKSKEETVTDKVDKVLLNKWAAFPIFLVVLYLVYYISIQTVGTWGTDWVNDVATGYVHEHVETWMDDNEVNEILVGLVCYGIIDGVFAVLGFVPQIIVIMFCLALLEECGYMARVAYMLDRLFMHFGLSGKTVVPAIVGVGCGVPGIMASRTIEDEQNRRIAAMTTTFIPCGAKLPILTLIIAAFTPEQYRALTALFFYVFGIFFILLSGLILKKFKGLTGTPSPFVMELPVYHEPGVRTVVTSTGERSVAFIRKAGTFILLAVTIIWFLSSFDWSMTYLGHSETNGSMLADIGNAITWIFLPNGFGNHWELSVATITGLLAKENLLGTVAILLNAPADDDGMITADALAAFATTGEAYSFLIFNLLCAPCFAAIGAMHRELGSWKATGAAVLYQCTLAYMVSTIYYSIWSIYAGRDGGALMYADLAVGIAFIAILGFFALVNDPVGRLKSKIKGASA